MRAWEARWNSFLDRYAAWWGRVGARGPVYALPREVIDELALEAPARYRGTHPIRPLIAREDAEAEHDFLATCIGQSSTIVGVWDRSPIDYPLPVWQAELAVPPAFSLMLEEYLNDLSRARDVPPETVRSTLSEATRIADEVKHQLLGYVGRLTFDEQYLR